MKIQKFALTLAVVTIAAVTSLIFLVPKWTKDRPYRLLPDDGKIVAIGARIYQSHCASCHGSNLEGQPEWRSRDSRGFLPAPPHNASGHTWHHSDETLFQITKLGVAHVIGDETYQTTMPIYSGVLNDEEIVAVLSWIKAQWPSDIRKSNELVNEGNP